MASLSALILVLVTTLAHGPADPPAPIAEAPEMRVGVFELPPYAMRSGSGDWSGVAVTLFREVAERMQLRYRLVPHASMAEALQAMEQGQLDLIAVGLDPTPDRERFMNFTHAFEQSGTGAAVRMDRRPTFAGLWGQVARSHLPLLLGMTLAIMLAMAAAVGLVERRHRPSSPGGSHIRTLGESIWWSITTMTTVGYGDRVPVTPLGRFLGGAWMLIGFSLMTILGGVIASELTVARFHPAIRSIAQLHGARCAAALDSAAMENATSEGLSPRAYAALDDALHALDQGQVDAVLGDLNALRWTLRDRVYSDLAVLPQPLVVEFVCLGMRPDLPDPLRDALNYWILQVSESARWQAYRRSISGENS
jgi:ABC-type amino acid transport substrate-binding protein